jgi:metallo-beta-lactamase family protein
MPLYTIEDAERVLPLFSTVEYGETVDLGDGAEAVFHDAGHILGSATIQVELGQRGDRRTIVFSGDLGRWKRVLLRDPEYYHHADYVVVESTYGDRLHPADMDPEEELAAVINSTVQAGGNVVIPSFAVERAQELLYHLKRLMVSARIPRLSVYMDSPMAASVTGLFERHIDLLDEEAAKQFKSGGSPLEFPGLIFTHTPEQSKAINSVSGAVIIAGAGMCNGGRIKHHLANNIGRPESTILFVGYQAHGTLGRAIVDGADPVRILGQQYPVRARIVKLDQFSAHADRDDLVRWLGGLRNPPRGVFAVHGEEEAAEAFRAHLSQKTGWRVGVPGYGDLVGL